MDFKDRIKQLREEKKISAAQLAGEFGKSEGAIRMWETGRTKPDADTLIKLAGYFSCTSDYLLGLSDFKNPNDSNAFSDKIKKALLADSSMSVNGTTTLLESALFCIRHIANLNHHRKGKIPQLLRDQLMIWGNMTASVCRLLIRLPDENAVMMASGWLWESVISKRPRGINDIAADVYMDVLTQFFKDNPEFEGRKDIYVQPRGEYDYGEIWDEEDVWQDVDAGEPIITPTDATSDE